MSFTVVAPSCCGGSAPSVRYHRSHTSCESFPLLFRQHQFVVLVPASSLISLLILHYLNFSPCRRIIMLFGASVSPDMPVDPDTHQQPLALRFVCVGVDSLSFLFVFLA